MYPANGRSHEEMLPGGRMEKPMGNAERILALIQGLRSISEDCAAGVQRRSYTTAYRQGVEFIKQKLQEAGLSTEEDGVGNLYGILPGSEYPGRWIFSGSHLDTVKCAGAYDGIAGVACALEAAHLIRESGKPLKCSFGVAGIIEEEGTTTGRGCMGSRFMTGKLKEEDMLLLHSVEDGRTLAEVLKDYGASGSINYFKGKDVRAFLELHGEQGPILDRADISLGVVDVIAGMLWLEITVRGESNHAGTTPMQYRRDAGAAAFYIAAEAERYVREKWIDAAVLTVGFMELFPNSPNSIPGKARFTLDIRATQEAVITDIRDYLYFLIERETNKGIAIDTVINLEKKPTPLSQKLQRTISDAAEQAEIPFLPINSGAGHDSMIFAEYFPTAMIFVPNKKGISHNPREYIAPEDLRRGAEVLYRTIRMIDEEESCR